ncbi:MAG: TolC family protein [Bacteroidetes bacterium]|nr:MAG: TolC family protein [Bacteroidota bacterium]
MIKHTLFLFLSLLLQPGLRAQDTAAGTLLTPEEAVRIALENNYDIRVVQGDVEIAGLNNTKGNAGMLPTINLVANETFTLSAFQQVLANGNEFNALGAPFNSLNAGVQLNWTLFDGKRMYITKKRLEEVEAQSQLNLKDAVQQTTASVLLAYYEIVRSRLLERSTEEIIALNEERLRIAEARLAAGFAAQTDALQARIDLNQQRSNLLSQQTATTAAKRTLNQLLARQPETAFSVTEQLDVNYTPNRDDLLNTIIAQNPQLLSAQKNAAIYSLMVDERRTYSKPQINGIGQLNLQRSDNGSGFLLNNTNAGLVIGGSLMLPLYSGGNIRRQVEVARVTAQQARMQAEALQLGLETELNNQLAFFLAQQQVLELESENIQNARESLTVSTERFRLGQTNALEVQSAQNTLEQALVRQNVVLYNLKTAELRLRLLAGEL